MLFFFKKKENTEAATKSAERSSVKKFVLKNFANFTGKHLCECFLIKWWPSACKFFKKKLQHKCFPVKFEKLLLRTSVLKKTCKRLLLEVFYSKAVLKNLAIFIGRLEVFYRKTVLKNFAIFIGRKWLVIKCSVKKVFLVVDKAVQVTCKNSAAG